MKHFRKVWFPDKIEFIKTNKQLNNKEMLEKLLELYPNSEITMRALIAKRSELRCSFGKAHKGAGPKPKPLFSEHVKKDYVLIKIAENTWISKARYIYQKAHPEYIFAKGDIFIFLDGNHYNFEITNIEVISKELKAILASFGGVIKDHPELTRINILNAKLKKARLDLAEKSGLCSYSMGTRQIRKEVNEKARIYQKKWRINNPEKYKAQKRRQYEKLTQEQKQKQNAYKRKWYQKKQKLTKTT